uniref:ACT domain-containing protein ACR n=1 Tax=Oryza punctata TaxID=4537 RepID=A0A0E0LXA9_ORYPU
MMTCGSPSTEVVDEFEKLVIRMNPPRVTVDNTSDMTATLVKASNTSLFLVLANSCRRGCLSFLQVDSANKYGTLLEVVQVLTDLKLTIKRAYISSDGEWFMDVFHVVDQDGNKLYDGQVIDRIELSLGAGSLSFRAPERSVEVEAATAQTAIELIGKDRPGLLSEVFAVLTDLKCNIVSSEVWTHDARMAALVHVTDADTLGAIDDQDRLDTVKRLLRHLLRGGGGARDRKSSSDGGRGLPAVEVVDCAERGYTLVNVRCRDRPKLLFDTVCTLTDMQYVVFHGTVIAEGSEAYQGLRLELCCEDRVGLLSDVTRIFREHGLSVTHAEVATRGARAANVFYVVAASGEPVEAHAVEAVRAEIGEQVLFVREDAGGGEPRSPPGRDGRRSLGNMIRSRSEKFLYNLGLIRSCS